MKKLTYKLILLAVTLVSGFTVNAATVWSVSDAAGNCISGAHGLWTNTAIGEPTCHANYFSISGTLTDFGDGTAELSATAVNPDGLIATIDLSFAGFTDNHNSLALKNGGSATPTEIDDWIFFTSVTGTINITTVGSFTALGMVADHGLQIGVGANDKTHEFGASMWLDMSGGNYGINHWDINMDLTPVPVPAAAWLFGTGLIGLVGVARRKAKA